MDAVEIMIKYILSFEKNRFLAVRYLCCSGACFTKELTITIKFYPAHYSLI
jgi:hypothetical protein